MNKNELKYNEIKKYLKNIPNIKEAINLNNNYNNEGMLYHRLFIPYTLNGWYIAGCDFLENDIKLLAIKKWNTPLVLTFKMETISLKELLNKYKTLKLDKKWKKEKYSNKFSSKKWNDLKHNFLYEN